MLPAIIAVIGTGTMAGFIQTAAPSPERLICSRELALTRPHYGLATLVVDRAHSPLRRSLVVSARTYRIKWSFPTEAFDLSAPPERFGIRTVTLPRNVVFPVSATLRFDGVVVWQREFARPTSQVMTVSHSVSIPQSAPPWEPGIDVAMGAGEGRSLLGVARVELLVGSADGAVRTTRTFEMPDWEPLRNEASRAAAELERRRLQRSCLPPPPPVV